MIERLLRPDPTKTSPLDGRSPATLWIAAWAVGMLVVHSLFAAASAAADGTASLGLALGRWVLVDLVTAVTVVGVCAVGSRLYTGSATGETVPVGPVSMAWYTAAGVLGGLVLCIAEATVGIHPEGPTRLEAVSDTLLVAAIVAALGAAANVLGNLGDQGAESNAALRDRMGELEGALTELRRTQDLAVEAEESVRKQMADMLHSRVQARLLATTLRLRRLEQLVETDPTSAARFLAEVRSDLDQIREQDVREVSHLLHPAVISIGLVPALRRLGMDLRGAADVVVDISTDLEQLDDVGEGRIPESVRLALYRTVEEATTNSLKHGDATLITITAYVEDGTVVVATTDNGCGFDVATAEPGLGTTTTASRLGRLGGTAEVVSAPGAGTTVVARVPLAGRTERPSDAADGLGQLA